MDEPKAPPPHAGERLTREDVERLIEEHGGPEGLDLREADLREAMLDRLDLPRVNLSRANLQGAGLIAANLEWADLSWANLQGALLAEADLNDSNLMGANLREARFWGEADLRRADLRYTDLGEADLAEADLRGARLAHAKLRDTDFEGASWGDYVLGDEIEGDFGEAASAYRALKRRHTEAGMHDVAGEFHYREWEARRKSAWRQQPLPRGMPRGVAAQVRHRLGLSERRLPYAFAMYLLRFLYGYGERPERVIGWAAGAVFGLALVHWAFGTVSGGFLDALYFSAVSFPALGYGEWAPEPQGWAGRFLGAGESFLGVFMIALFLVTFTRKMTR